jgi:hypothetical protein
MTPVPVSPMTLPFRVSCDPIFVRLRPTALLQDYDRTHLDERVKNPLYLTDRKSCVVRDSARRQSEDGFGIRVPPPDEQNECMGWLKISEHLIAKMIDMLEAYF